MYCIRGISPHDLSSTGAFIFLGVQDVAASSSMPLCWNQGLLTRLCFRNCWQQGPLGQRSADFRLGAYSLGAACNVLRSYLAPSCSQLCDVSVATF